MTMRTPRDEFWNRERVDIIHKLFDNQVVRNAKICGGKTPVRESKINAVHTEGNLVFQLTEVSLLQAGTIPNNKGAFTFMNVFQTSKTPDALTPPGMQVRGGQLRDTPYGIVGITAKCPQRLGDNLFESLFHYYWTKTKDVFLLSERTTLCSTLPLPLHPPPKPAQS